MVWLLGQLHDNGTVEAENAQIEFRASPRFSGKPLPDITNVDASRSEQSNSTIIVDNQAVLKFYRRISRGVSPEVEMGRFLTDVVGFAHAPALLGTVELVEKVARSTLAVMHEFVENQGDAWSFTTAYLDRMLEEARLLTGEASVDPQRHAAFFHRMTVLGRRLGELHLALASRPDYPDFAPEPATPADLKEWTERLVTATERIFDRLKKDRRKLDPKTQELAATVIDQREALLKAVRKLLPAKLDVDKIRHHGDFHLGQTLIVKDDAFIIDFEGEPHRSEAERQAKAPSARDAAGLIRSLDYAATTALNAVTQSSPEEAARMTQAIEQWRRHSEAAFLAGIREVAGTGRLWPQDSDTAQRLLRFYVAEKAIYEIGYELANRPEWVPVPLSGVTRAILTETKAPA